MARRQGRELRLHDRRSRDGRSARSRSTISPTDLPQIVDDQITMSEMLGLYLHIPFCSAICNYCNFNRGLFDAALKGAIRRRAGRKRSGV